MSGTPAEPAELAAALNQFAQAYRGYQERLATLAGLHATDITAASTLLVEPRTPRQLELALELTSGAITSVIDRLEKRGFATRVPSQVDRRSVTVTLTSSGVEFAQGALGDFEQLVTNSITGGWLTPRRLRAMTASLEAAKR